MAASDSNVNVYVKSKYQTLQVVEQEDGSVEYSQLEPAAPLKKAWIKHVQKLIREHVKRVT